MGLLSIFKRRAESPPNTGAAPASPTDAVQRARTRARQRLIGAIVLVGIGVIGFPLVFETQPRPIPVDIPIEVPPKDSAPALVMPAARTPAAATKAAPASAAAIAPASPNDVITESREDAGREIAPPAPPASPVVPPAARAASKPVAVVAVEPVPRDKAADRETIDAARAKALLDGKTAKPQPESGGRFVVQVGAFADAGAARETRLKAEKLGLKTYTQVAATSAGQRIRVRVGPFGTRDEADKALARARGAGLTAVVLTL